MGQCVLLALKAKGETASCFCDNNTAKQKEKFCGLEVLSVEAALKKYKNPVFYLCFYDNANLVEVTKQLKEKGAKNIEDCTALLYDFHTKILHRPKTQNYKMLFENPVKEDVINHVLVVTTNKCTLKCVDCGHLITHYTNPKHYPKEEVIKSIQNLANSVDYIDLLSIVGGEPLLHPNIDEIIKYAGERENIKTIRMVTNGTIIPSKQVINAIKKYVSYVAISNYGKLSKNIGKLDDILSSEGVVTDVMPEDTSWFAVGLPLKPGRNKEETREIYDVCCWGKGCSAIQQGELHICNYSSTTKILGLVENKSTDYVNLLDDSVSIEERKAKIHTLLKGNTPPTACKYCNFDFTTQIPVARQKEED